MIFSLEYKLTATEDFAVSQFLHLVRGVCIFCVLCMCCSCRLFVCFFLLCDEETERVASSVV
jgi:hypothetical protein